MNIAVLGTGLVGQTIASKLVQLGHTVMMGSRSEAHPTAVTWSKDAAGGKALFGNFTDACKFGEIVFNCTQGAASVDALRMGGAGNLKGKIIIDTSNPIEYSGDEYWKLTVCNTDSLGEQIQREFPDALVVKTLNTVNSNVMVEPDKLIERTDVFVSGNSADAKATVTKILRDWFGWQHVIDLGDITTSRAAEMYVVLWRSLRLAISSRRFNIKVVTS